MKALSKQIKIFNKNHNQSEAVLLYCLTVSDYKQDKFWCLKELLALHILVFLY